MAASSPSEASSHSPLDCHICYEGFTESGSRIPRTLPNCGHTFCHTCLTGLLQSRTSKCPLCQSEIVRKAATEFHPCYALIAVLSTQRVTRASPAVASTPKCANCQVATGVHWCATCKGTTCAPCWDVVHQSPMLKSHKKKPASAEQEKKQRQQMKKETVCKLHPGNTLSLVCIQSSCPQKGSLICILCERKSHQGHTTKLVEDVSEEKREQLKSMLERLEAATSNVNRVLLTVQDTRRSLCSPTEAKETSRTTEQEAVARIRRTFEEYRAVLAAREQELIDHVHGLATAKTELLDQQSDEMTAFLSNSYEWSQRASTLLTQPDDFSLVSKFLGIETEFQQLAATQLHLSAPRVDSIIGLSLPAASTLAKSGSVTPSLPFPPSYQPREVAVKPALDECDYHDAFDHWASSHPVNQDDYHDDFDHSPSSQPREVAFDGLDEWPEPNTWD